MCKQRGRSFCSELGVNTSHWSRDAPLAKPEWIEKASQAFSVVIQMTQEGNLDDAKSLLKELPDLEMREWFSVHAQNSGAWRNNAFGIRSPSPIMPLDPVKAFTKFEPSVFVRDKFCCRYCSSKVFPKKYSNTHVRLLGPKLFP